MNEDTLKDNSLEWALNCINRYGDTDIFPVPFEFEAIQHNWIKVKEFLSNINLSQYTTNAIRNMLMPKTNDSFRIVRQLNPLDSLIYNAILFELADDLESHRVIKEKSIACSYRINIQSDGRIFSQDNGWSDFHKKSKELAESGNYNFVIVADIADFYNQVYHHRVQNVIETATKNKTRADNIENFLSSLTKKHSRGLPVGPIPSIVLAEACLDDVDKKLMNLSVAHSRYVDDFRIMCKTKKEALFILQELISYLYTAHRFTLQSHKTKILGIDEFLQKELFGTKHS